MGAGAGGKEGLLNGEAPFREKGCWGGCLGSIAAGAEDGPRKQSSRFLCARDDARARCWAPSQVDVDDAGQRLIIATGVRAKQQPERREGLQRRPGLRGHGQTATSEARRDAESASPTKKPIVEGGVCGGGEAQSWTREETINFAPCSGLRSGSAWVWVWVWVWGRERKCSGWMTRRPTCRFGPARPHAANQTESAPSPPAPTGSGLAAIEDSVPLLHRPDWAGRCRPTGTWARAGEGGTAEQCAVETVEREKNKSRAGRQGFWLALAEGRR